MGRRRWRFVAVAAFLFFIGDILCQDEDDFYYTPVERNFAQVQPPLFPNSRPVTYFENADSIRIAPQASQNIYNDGQIRVPSPNYNQNPSPFQVPTGRSQSGNQFYINQPDFGAAQKQRFRPALPHNYQFISTTRKPNLSQIHSSAYQNDPSKPETFLGQITINNPDVDYLQNNRFKNIPFDGNSLKVNGQTGQITREELDNDEFDLFDQHKVTTFNPNKLTFKQSQLSLKPNGARFSHFPSLTEPKKVNLPNSTSRVNVSVKLVNNPITSLNSKYQSSTEYKALLELQPLLEDDINESYFKELMKNPKESDDVQVIKSKVNNNRNENNDDSKPDASSMKTDNLPNSMPEHIIEIEDAKNETRVLDSKITETQDLKEENIDDNDQSEEVDDTEYVEYYDDESNYTTILPVSTEGVTDIYDEYDATEEPEQHTQYKDTNTTESFDVLLTKPNNTMVQDDNFKHFIDTTVIDQPEIIHDNNTDNPIAKSFPLKDQTLDTPSILGQEVVSVVTTKSVVNGTISVPQFTYAPTERNGHATESSNNLSLPLSNDTNMSVTTENWVVVASVQTSRSISGARFLPFPTVEQEEKKQFLAEDDEDDEQISNDDTKEATLDKTTHTNNSTSTENINDKLDSIQSELSSAVLSGTLNNENKNIELISEPVLDQNISLTIETTTPSFNLFTLKSTQGLPYTELSSPSPLPVMIKKFTPRMQPFTTPKPKRKPSLSTVADSVDGLLPPGFRQPSYKNRRVSSTTLSTTITTTTSAPIITTEEYLGNGTQGRSLGSNSKNKVILLDDKSLLPKEYIPKENKPKDINFKNLEDDDISKFLPPGYKESTLKSSKSNTSVILDKIKEVDNSAFLPKDYNLGVSSTEKPKPKTKPFDKIKEIDVSSFLPKDYKVSTSTEKTKEKTNVFDKIEEVDISAFLPKDFKFNVSATENPKNRPKTYNKIQGVDVSSLLPKDYNITVIEKDNPVEEILNKVKEVDISAFLPKGYQSNLTATHKSSTDVLPKTIKPVDKTAFLPPSYKLNETQEYKDNNLTFKVDDISKLLPPDFKSNKSEELDKSTTTTNAPGGFKLVFPSRPGGKVLRKTTPKPGGMGPSPVTPSIQKGWPTRASTEFTGWPSPPTTPLSIEKLLEALANEKDGTSTSSRPGWSPDETTRAITTTTTTTTTPPPPPSTTPGICQRECEIAATIKIVDGVKWVPELQDPHTEEWQKLAKEIKDELNSVYSKSDLRKWYKNIHIDSFSKGSVLVDYFIELNNVEEKINTLELKHRFHQSLTQAEPVLSDEVPQQRSLDPDVMLGDQPEEDKMRKSNERMTKTLDKTPKLEMGKFIMDPAYTEFIVVQKREEPKEEEPEEESVLPQWGIAVIVIAMASLLFVVIFGVTVLVNRQKNTKMKQPIPLSDDMLRELDKNHMGGYEDNHQLKERDLPYLPTGKRMSTAFIEQLAYPNPGDSWRSEWTPQMQKYMQHYATDSGRGTQLYGAAGNVYGYGGSQVYGHTGGGSQIYGYTGEYPRSHHSRRRSEYDSNF